MNEGHAEGHDLIESIPQEQRLDVVGAMNKSDIESFVEQAHRWPRNMRSFNSDLLSMSTVTEAVAEQCSYALPRGKKTIVGPSARFTEMILIAWRNAAVGSRIIDDKGSFVIVQGLYRDWERNIQTTAEVARRITDKDGRRYNDDMIGVTMQAASSIARRNAIITGVPRALWHGIWEQAKQTAVGDATTLANRRANAVACFAHYGVLEKQLLAKLERASMDDVSVDDLAVLIGWFNVLKEGEMTPEELFAVAASATPVDTGKGADALKAAVTKAQETAKATAAAGAGPTGAATEVEPSKATDATPSAAAPAAEAAASKPSETVARDLIGNAEPETTLSFAQVADYINKAAGPDDYTIAETGIATVADEGQRNELTALLAQRKEANATAKAARARKP